MTTQSASTSSTLLGTSDGHHSSDPRKATDVQCVHCHPQTTSEPKGAINGFLLLTCVVFAAASLLFGFDDKIISPVASLQPFVSKYQGINPVSGDYVLTARNQNLVFSVPLVGSILGGLAASPFNFHFGRKRPVIFAYIISIAGGLLQVLAPNLGAFVSGRFINGIAMGIANGTAPLYLSEVVPASMRGRSVSSLNILNVAAGVLGTIVVYATKKLGGRESYMIPLAVQCALPALLSLCTWPLPESPLWLVGKGRMDEARRNLRKLRGCSDERVEDELGLLRVSEAIERELKANVSFWEIFSRKHVRRTLTSGSFYSLNQISGVILSTTYGTVFLTEIGTKDPFSLTVIAACCTLAGTIVAPFVLDRVGRRPTALVGMSAIFIVDAVAGGLAFNHGDPRSTAAIAALSFVLNFFWASSFFSLSTLMPSEMATPRLRHHTIAYTVACAQTTAVVTTFVIPQLTAADAADLGAKAYLIFAGCMACIIVFVYFLMPETRGRTFVEIDEMYEAGVPAWKWRVYKSSSMSSEADHPVPRGSVIQSSDREKTI
ncbi:general substrate transporter [Aspergillus ambiguus]|uniref:general substrate transporter n=1 Tax=Aspergillus ambiguus TaxID=176160 RepID=UPI003CCD5ECA